MDIGGDYAILKFVVKQVGNEMIVVSRHRLLDNAVKAAQKRARWSEDTIFGAVSLIGNPRKNYKVGDVLDPQDIYRHKVKDRCSECCDNCVPDSLNYRCPMTRDTPLCDTVAAHRFLPLKMVK